MPNFQTDVHGILNGQSPYADKGFGDVAVAPPSTIPAGQVVRWVSRVDAQALEYGEPGTGEWQVVDDNRHLSLYTPEGPYSLGQSYFGEIFDGLGALPTWLSVEPLPGAAPTLDQLREQQLAVINAGFEQAVLGLTTGYPATERLTWPLQQSEVLAWSADSSAPTPYLDGIAAARGIPATEMRQKALTQVHAFLAVTQEFIGVRQRLRDQLDAAETAEAIALLVWPASSKQA